MADEADTWQSLGPASWQADDGPEVKFAVVSRKKSSGNRLPERARPYQDGSKSDHTGRKADEFAVEAIFQQDATSEEADLGDTPAMWPDRINLLDAQLGSRKVGTLHLPWERNIRCRAVTWERSALPEDLRGGERMSITFRRDNEDNLDGSAIEEVSVRATVRRAADEAVFDLEREGMWDGSIEDFTALAADVEGLLAAPGEFRQDMLHMARRLGNAAASIRSSFMSRVPGRDKGNDPDSAVATQRLLEIEELSARALAEAASSQPPLVARRFDTDRDLYSIAAELRQDAEALIEVNPQIEDPSDIQAGSTVFVFVQ